MRGSGKQVLLRILEDLSTRVVPQGELGDATRRLRAGLLMHGSTSDESFRYASRLQWGSDLEAGEPIRQGIVVGAGADFLSDLYETVFSMPGLQEFVAHKHPALRPIDYEAFEWAMWLLVSAVQMFTQLNSVENSKDVDVEYWVNMLATKYDYFHGHSRSEDGEP